MGLDQYLYEVTRLTAKEKAKIDKMSYDDIDGEYNIVEVDDDPDSGLLGLEGHKWRDIKDWVYVVEREVEEYDMGLVRAAFNLPDKAHFAGCMISSSGVTHFVSDDSDEGGGDWPYPSITDAELKEKNCFVMVKHKFAVYKTAELAYWRKEYDLQQLMHDAYDSTIDNCMYAKLNSKMIKSILRWQKNHRNVWDYTLTEDDLRSTNERLVCYYEWY